MSVRAKSAAIDVNVSDATRAVAGEKQDSATGGIVFEQSRCVIIKGTMNGAAQIHRSLPSAVIGCGLAMCDVQLLSSATRRSSAHHIWPMTVDRKSKTKFVDRAVDRRCNVVASHPLIISAVPMGCVNVLTPIGLSGDRHNE